jgi:acetyl-CoA carboxylase biotin carboxyl carrier protein
VNEAKLRQLLKLFAESDLEELELQHSFWHGTRIKLSRGVRHAPVHAEPAAAPAAPPPTAPTEPPAAEPADNLQVFTSPMVGTFYRSSSPETEPFVREGDRVKVGQVICIIEAMKIMNEVPVNLDGEIVEILANNIEPVEYGQPLFKIRPS